MMMHSETAENVQHDRAYRAWSLGFIVAFLTFTTLDIFGPALERQGRFTSMVEPVKWISLAIAAAAFFYLILYCLTSFNGSCAVAPIGGHLRFCNRMGDPLLVLRLLAFFGVWMTHSALLLKPPATIWDPQHFLLRGCAHQGMTVFFTLSGYLMGKAFARGRYETNSQGIKSFYLNRALRILPLYIFAQLFVMILVHPDLLFWANWRGLLGMVTFTYFSLPGQPGPITALWSLSTEVQYYLIAPFVFLLLAKSLTSLLRASGAVLLVMAIGTVVRLEMIRTGMDWSNFIFKPLITNLDLFIVGLLFNGIVEAFVKRPSSTRTRTYWFLFGFLLMLAIYFGSCSFTGLPWLPYGTPPVRYPASPNSLSYQVAPSILALFTGLTILCLELGAWRFTESARRSKDNKPILPVRLLQFLGICTYGMYVWHVPILEALNRVLPQLVTFQDYKLRNALALGTVIVIAATTYVLVEKPFDAKKQFKR
jgi:peptidoglycan/LPS O-acetylase OafA/YrhL